MKTSRKDIKALKHLLKDDSHSKHHLKIEITKNILPHIFDEEPKEETFVVSKKQIDVLCGKNEVIHEMMREWFPSAFVEDKKVSVLETGKWYVYPAEPKFITFVKENGKRYGIGCSGNWFYDSDIVKNTLGYREATPEEVFEALKNEAINRGYKKYNHKCLISTITLTHLQDTYELDKGKLWYGGKYANCVFKDGIWAEITPTITKS